MMRRLLALALFLALAPAASAEDGRAAVIEKWYTALAAIDRGAFETLLADNAAITLEDLDVEQTKREFIDSLDEWEEAMQGASIKHRISEETPGNVTVAVCYIFPGNESLTREVFTIDGGKVTRSVQTTITDSCAEY
jgi:hypothetical protein